MLHKIAILLSTYNSSLYLKEQLDSLLQQTNHEWELFIRDDGSTDNTLEIVTQYINKYKNFNLIKDDKAGLGPRDSFLHLLQVIEADFYMFCDHDDVWLPHKIEATLEKMQSTMLEHPNQAILICSDLCIVDSNLNTISDSLWNLCKIKPKILSQNYKYLSICNFVTGCTVMINHAVKEKIYPYPLTAPMHDFYLALRIAACGIIEYIPTPLILYRQHDTNVIGAEAYPKHIIIKKIKSFRKFIFINNHLYKVVSSVVSISYIEYWFYKVRYFFKRLAK